MNKKINKNKMYLYLKIAPSGLMYLGKRERKDVYSSYLGSGVYWKNHLKKYNYTQNDITTIILFETYDIENFKKLACYYSKIWNITSSDKFANLCDESGISGLKNPSIEVRNKISVASKNRSLETRLKISKSNTGKKRTEEQKKIISDILKNRSAETKLKISYSKKGKTVTEETRLKMKLAQSNRSESTKRKMSESQKKKKLSEETKLKIKKAMLGKTLTETHKQNISKPVLQFNKNGSFIKEWCSAKIAMKELNVLHISNVCKNKSKSAGGFLWRYKN